jgi:hypothetical protein
MILSIDVGIHNLGYAIFEGRPRASLEASESLVEASSATLSSAPPMAVKAADGQRPMATKVADGRSQITFASLEGLSEAEVIH